MFVETPFGGFAYLYLDEDSDANLISSSFSNLPEIGPGTMAAPVVIADINLDITNSTFEGNRASFQSGGVIVAGGANVDFTEVSQLSLFDFFTFQILGPLL